MGPSTNATNVCVLIHQPCGCSSNLLYMESLLKNGLTLPASADKRPHQSSILYQTKAEALQAMVDKGIVCKSSDKVGNIICSLERHERSLEASSITSIDGSLSAASSVHSSSSTASSVHSSSFKCH